jgi:adenosylcobinamide-GDP ribazoletransferase
MKGLLAALGFLTILPVPARRPWPGLGPALPYFPLVGLLVGVALLAADLSLGSLLGNHGRAAALVAVWAALTGGLHLEGVADAADGLLASRSAPERLEIMRDPAAGAFGVIAVGLVLLLKFGLLLDLPGASASLAAVPLAARYAVLPPMALFPYARPEGLGQGLAGPARRAALLNGLPTVGAVYLLAGPAGLAGLSLALAGGLMLAGFARRRVGGLTGDVCGAIIEAAEVSTLFGYAVWGRVR